MRSRNVTCKPTSWTGSPSLPASGRPNSQFLGPHATHDKIIRRVPGTRFSVHQPLADDPDVAAPLRTPVALACRFRKVALHRGVGHLKSAERVTFEGTGRRESDRKTVLGARSFRDSFALVRCPRVRIAQPNRGYGYGALGNARRVRELPGFPGPYQTNRPQ